MRYALISDIHANWQAWNTVLLDIRSSGVDRIVCLGDVVGYGPNPAEVLASVHANVEDIVLGNHDAVICDKLDASLFNDEARSIILWTREHLSCDAVDFLKTLPLSLHGDGFRCAHGDFSDPASFHYVIEPKHALPSWHAVDERLLFVGHTHRPAIFFLDRDELPLHAPAQDFLIEDDRKYLVNVGSVGQPRDGEARACYCIYDTDEAAIRWRRIPFDIDAYRAALDKVGVSSEPSYFLAADPRTATKPLREMLNFSPAQTPEQAAKNAIPVQEIHQLKRKAARWKGIAGGVLLLFLLAGLGVGAAVWERRHRALELRDPHASPIAARQMPFDQNLLAAPASPVKPGRVVPGWHVRLSHRRKQSVGVSETADGSLAFLINSETDLPMRMSSPPILVEPGDKLALQTMAKNESGGGSVTLDIALTRRTEGGVVVDEHFVSKTPNMPRKEGWFQTRQTFDVPAGGMAIECRIVAQRAGRVLVRDLSLVRKSTAKKPPPPPAHDPLDGQTKPFLPSNHDETIEH